MILEYLWNLLIGYVTITIEGLSMEKLINLASFNNINIWDLKRNSYTILSAKTSYHSFKKLKKLAENKYTIKVLNAKGVPHNINRVYFRKALFFGIISSLIIIIFFSMFIWQIEVIGNYDIKKDVLLKEVYSMGIKTPMLKRKIEFDDLEKNIIINNDNISWANFSFEGIKLKLEIVETKVPKKPKNPLGVANVVADKDGYITKVLVFEGQSNVEEGMTVVKGQNLIKGECFDKKGNFRLYEADGIIYADIWYMGIKSMPLYKNVEIRSGRSHEIKYLKFGKSIGLINKLKSYDKYESEIVGCIYLGENLSLPIKLITEKRYETISIRQRIDKKKVKQAVKQAAYETAFDKIIFGTEIIKEKVVYIENDEELTAAVFLKTNEDIAKKITVD